MKWLSDVCMIESTHIDLLLLQNKSAFLALFAEEEKAYCFARKHWKEPLAARFAAKKAAFTILGASEEIRWNTILVAKYASGMPYIFLQGSAALHAQTLRLTHWHLSLSHTTSYAAAFVVAEQVPEANSVSMHPEPGRWCNRKEMIHS